MKYKFKEVSLELYTDNVGKHNIRLDNILNNQYINLLTTADEIQAVILYQELYDVLKRHEDK